MNVLPQHVYNLDETKLLPKTRTNKVYKLHPKGEDKVRSKSISQASVTVPMTLSMICNLKGDVLPPQVILFDKLAKSNEYYVQPRRICRVAELVANGPYVRRVNGRLLGHAGFCSIIYNANGWQNKDTLVSYLKTIKTNIWGKEDEEWKQKAQNKDKPIKRITLT